MDRNIPALPDTEGPDSLRPVLRVVLVVVGVIVALLAAWQVREAILLVFASVVVAVLLLAAAEPLERRTGLSRSWSLALIGVVSVLLLAGFAWLAGAPLKGQVAQFSQKVPEAIKAAEQTLGITLLPKDGGNAMGGIGAVAGDLFGSLVSFGTTVAGALTGLVVVVVGGFFFAADPALYRRGLVRLFPQDQRARADEAMQNSGGALRLWLFAQLIAMAMIGVMVGLGTWALGLPSPLALGLFAGLLEFIPMIGPIAGAVPPLLLAMGMGGSTVLWTLLLFVVVQQLESNVIMPIVQRQMVELPPALLLFAVIAVGLLFGVVGVLIAAPLTVVLYVLVKQLYIRETLGEPTEVPGEKAAGNAA